jgi:uncharacterized protein (TIGR01777 family)
MRIAITGASGFIGTALSESLRVGGHDVVALVRRAPRSADEASWDPDRGAIDAPRLEGLDGVVHLAGVGIGSRRWSARHKRRVLESRVRGTTLLARALAGLSRPPSVLLSSSAIGFYGDGGEAELTEDSPSGAGYLADVCRRWEGAAEPAAAAGIRVVPLRSGLVLSPRGGVLRVQLLPFKAGLGGVLGRGTQWQSWITLRDEIAAITHLLSTEATAGPVNLTTPRPVTNRDFTRILGRVLGRPTVARVPAAVIKLALGPEMAQELLLFSQRVLPRRLEASGFRWSDPELEAALRDMLGRDGS